jgi:hypothetical protein
VCDVNRLTIVETMDCVRSDPTEESICDDRATSTEESG